MNKFIPSLLVGILCSSSLMADESKDIKLQEPQLTLSGTLMNALQKRHSSREYSNKEIPLQELSNLLWAAGGVTRENFRTFPSAMNKQVIDIYVVKADGIYLYDYQNNALIFKVAGDYRKNTGLQPFVADAPLNLVYVADTTKMPDLVKTQTEKDIWAANDTGFIAQNVYLYCANNNLATVVRGSIPREELAKIMQLKPTQIITLSQTVGYEK